MYWSQQQSLKLHYFIIIIRLFPLIKLKSLFAVAENYPDLKANSNFQQLQNKLSETEDKIAYSKQFYNDVVLRYNNAGQQFPSSMLAKIFGYKIECYFEAPKAKRTVPKVEF